jgi:excisionase family DNA binding protein
MDDAMMTPSQVAEYLSVPVATLYAWRHRGGGPPAIRVGKHLRYRREDVERWLDARADPEPA